MIPRVGAGVSFPMRQPLLLKSPLLRADPRACRLRRPAARNPKPQTALLRRFRIRQTRSRVWTQQITGDNIITVQQDKVAHGKYALLVRCPTPAQRTRALLFAKDLPSRCAIISSAGPTSTSRRECPFATPSFSPPEPPAFPPSKYQEVATSNGNLAGHLHRPGRRATKIGTPPARFPLGPLVPARVGVQRPARPSNCLGRRREGHRHAVHLQAPTTDLVGGFTDITLGFRLRGAAPVPFDIYYDDIALDTHRIGPVK